MFSVGYLVFKRIFFNEFQKRIFRIKAEKKNVWEIKCKRKEVEDATLLEQIEEMRRES